MSHRKTLIAAAVGAAALTGAGAAVAASGGKTATLKAVASGKVVINKYEQDSSHWSPGTVTIKSGGTLTIANVGGAPHTFSIVKKSQLPKTIRQVNECAICQKLGEEHGAPQDGNGPPTKPVLDVGAPGIDQVGDSVVIAPNAKTTKLKVSAKKGTTLYFLCAIHPWMQGKLQVK